jgi:hypothetical protein
LAKSILRSEGFRAESSRDTRRKGSLAMLPTSAKSRIGVMPLRNSWPVAHHGGQSKRASRRNECPASLIICELASYRGIDVCPTVFGVTILDGAILGGTALGHGLLQSQFLKLFLNRWQTLKKADIHWPCLAPRKRSLLPIRNGLPRGHPLTLTATGKPKTPSRSGKSHCESLNRIARRPCQSDCDDAPQAKHRVYCRCRDIGIFRCLNSAGLINSLAMPRVFEL